MHVLSNERRKPSEGKRKFRITIKALILEEEKGKGRGRRRLNSYSFEHAINQSRKMKERKVRRTGRDSGKNSTKGKINRQKDNRVEVLR